MFVCFLGVRKNGKVYYIQCVGKQTLKKRSRGLPLKLLLYSEANLRSSGIAYNFKIRVNKWKGVFFKPILRPRPDSSTTVITRGKILPLIYKGFIALFMTMDLKNYFSNLGSRVNAWTNSKQEQRATLIYFNCFKYKS